MRDVHTETNTIIWPRFMSFGADSVFMNSSTTIGFWRAPRDGDVWRLPRQ